MEEFIHRRNIERFKRLLQAATADADRARIESLLAEEEAKDSILKSPPPDQTDAKDGG